MAKKKTKKTTKKTKKKARRKPVSRKKKVASKRLSKHELVTRLKSIRNDLDSLLMPALSLFANLPPSNSVVFFDIGETTLTRQPNGTFAWISEAKIAVETLQSKGVRIGLISNTGTETRSSLASIFPTGFFGQFDSQLIVLSSEVQVEKPALGIFYHALKLAQIPASHCMFVVEKQSEVFAAQQAGMKSIRIANHSTDFEFLSSLFN